MKITEHAIDQYIERVAEVSRAEARKKLLAIHRNGHPDFEVVIRKDALITVIPKAGGSALIHHKKIRNVARKR